MTTAAAVTSPAVVAIEQRLRRRRGIRAGVAVLLGLLAGLVVADHAGNAATGATQTETLHRIEESVERAELEAAGFRLADEGEFLRNPSDPRDAPFFKATVPVDGFVLKYAKP